MTTPRTVVEYATHGSLVQRSVKHPKLEEYSGIVLDQCHEIDEDFETSIDDADL